MSYSDDEFDIYGDLDAPAAIDAAEVEKLKSDLVELTEKYNEALKAIEKFKKDNLQLKQNISSLLLTAKCELKRRENQINDLNREKEDMCFRRTKMNKQEPIKKKVERYTQTEEFCEVLQVLENGKHSNEKHEYNQAKYGKNDTPRNLDSNKSKRDRNYDKHHHKERNEYGPKYDRYSDHNDSRYTNSRHSKNDNINRFSKTSVERNPTKRSNDDNYSCNSNSKKAKFEQFTDNIDTTKQSEKKDILKWKNSAKEENTEERQRDNKKTKIIENQSKNSGKDCIEEYVPSIPQSNIPSGKNVSSDEKGFSDKSNKEIITATCCNNLDDLSEINITDRKSKSTKSDTNVTETKNHLSHVKSDEKTDSKSSTKTRESKSPLRKCEELRKEPIKKVSEDSLFDSFDSLPEFESNIENLNVAEDINLENQNTKVTENENISIINDFNSNQLSLYRNLSELEQESIQALQEISMGDSRHNFRETKMENTPKTELAPSNCVQNVDSQTLDSLEETNFTNKIEKQFIGQQDTSPIKNPNISGNFEKTPAELPLPDSTTQNLVSLDDFETSSELISAQKLITEDNTESLTIELKSLADSPKLEQENCLENLKISIPDNSFKSNHSAEYRIEVNQNEINVFINRKKRKSRSKPKTFND